MILVRYSHFCLYNRINILRFKFNFLPGYFKKQLLINSRKITYINQYPYDAKLAFSLTALLVTLGLIKEEEKSELIMTLQRGEYLYKLARYNDSEQMFHIALRLAQQFDHEDAVIYIYDRLANVAFENKQYEKCTKLFKIVLHHILSKEIPPDDRSIIHISLKIATAYEKLKNMKEAEVGYEFCINNLEPQLPNAIEENNIDLINLWIQVTHAYANYHYNFGNIQTALKYGKSAYEIAFRNNNYSNDNMNEEYIMLLDDLAKMYLHIGDLDNAQTFADKGLMIAKQMPDMPYISNFYITFAGIALQRNLLNDALVNCKKALTRANYYEYTDGIVASTHCVTLVQQKLKDQNLSSNLINITKAN